MLDAIQRTLEFYFTPSVFAYTMAAQYIALALWQLARGEQAWAGMWLCYGVANIFVGGKQ